MNLKNIIFDFDGVIADTFDIIYSLALEHRHDLTEEMFLAHHDGNVYEDAVDIDHDMTRQIREAYRSRLTISHIANAIEPIRTLGEQYRLFIISSNDEPAIKTVLEAANIAQYFEAVMGFETETSKVKKFQMLQDEYEVKLAESVFVTDTLGDVTEAERVGLKTIAETFGFHNRERLAQGKPHVIVDTWEETLNEIEKFS